MKKWTVMLIPHDRGGTHTLEVSSSHFIAVAVLLVGLTFTSTFFFQRHRAMERKANELHQLNRVLAMENARKPAAPKVVREGGLSEEEAREIEDRLRAEYERMLAAITAELGDLYDMESKARELTGLAPRETTARDIVEEDTGGKGGPPGAIGMIAYVDDGETIRPPNIIYGMSKPPADLILQEIQLRTQSFEELVADMEAEADRVARIPSIWPLHRGVGRITSNYGYRRDPFHGRVRHHNGTDISARTGTKIVSTARGRVVESTYDRYYGHLVKVDHGNGMQTWYAHMQERLAKAGQQVERGDVIGTLGSSGRSTGPHLHYEVRVGKKTVDSAKYLTD